MKNEILIFNQYVSRKGLNSSAKRDSIVRAFFETRDHVSAEDLYFRVKKGQLEIGYTTVYRTLKLIAESGLAEVVDFDDGVKRYERKVGRDYHAHCICSRCGQSFEVFHKDIQSLTYGLAKKNGFVPQKSRFEIFGLCRRCRKKPNPPETKGVKT